MDAADAVNLGVSVGLGLLSIVLGAFSIWLSLVFSRDSNQSLKEIRDLSGQIRLSVETSVSQQKDFSVRMLDSILEQNRFERPLLVSGGQSDVRKVIASQLEELEDRIYSKVENTVRDLAAGSGKNEDQVEAALEAIKANIKGLREAASEVSGSFDKSRSVRESLKTFLAFPAHYVVLAAVLRSGAQTVKELEKTLAIFRLPHGWQKGINNLVEQNLLLGSESHFELPPDSVQALKDWFNENGGVIDKLNRLYAVDQGGQLSEAERDIVRELRF